jgi:two-component system, OmpR family, phosphate regulon sensor histidine kinase PhoR
MILSKRTIRIVIVVATIALVGLSVLQIQNLRNAMDTNNQIFDQKVDLASGLISNAFSKNRDYPNLLAAAAERIDKTGELNDKPTDELLTRLIDDVFEQCGLDIPYEYAVYKHQGSSAELFSFVLGDKGSSLDFELASCENPQSRGHGWATLTCNLGYGDESNFHLGLFFPNKDAYVFAQSSGALMLSIAFIALLLCCFAYTVVIIQKQKKLSIIKNEFINNLTHEFKTPIASISLAANLMRNNEDKVDEKKRLNYLDLIDHESKRLEGQVDKVLQIAMIDSGNFSLEKKEIDVHTVIKQVVDSMNLLVSNREGRIELQLDAIQSNVMADETHLVNIIYNLLDNALKYTRDIPLIKISTSDEKEGVQITVKDNGIGIGKEIQKYIFDKFYRAESGNVHNVKGFGLGLSYVKKIIEAHRGKIDLYSRINQGSEFKLYFPFN